MPVWSVAQLAYCSNVHPGITPDEIENNLRQITAKIRQRRGLSRMQIGLWINQEAANAYQSAAALSGLKTCLQQLQLDVVTLNGFPQGNFHEAVVKENVYLPTWAEKSRLNYTLTIAHLLAECMTSDQVLGTISTLPLAYRFGWDKKKHHIACQNLCLFAMAMARVEDQTGKHIRLCLEMEPGCVLENAEQTVMLFTQDLPHVAKVQGLDYPLIQRYLGVCYDVCHQVVMQETIETSIGKLHQANIHIGKVQVSSALRVDRPDLPDVRAQLHNVAEPKYLHQTTTRNRQGNVVFKDDLVDALNDAEFPDQSAWWVHFHVPIQINNTDISSINTTQQSIKNVFDFLASTLPYAPHLEVETYTWELLGAAHWLSTKPTTGASFGRQRLIEGIVNELSWLEQVLAQRNLLKK